jgi:hypothetical protein
MRDIDRFYARTPGEEYTWSRLLSPEASNRKATFFFCWSPGLLRAWPLISRLKEKLFI